jgi:hypothetical protein
MFGFNRHEDVEHSSVSPSPLTNPPVIPIWINPLQMHISIDCWLDNMIGNPQVGWQRRWFPYSSQVWQLNILQGICGYYQGQKPDSGKMATTAHQTLRWALKMTVLNYVMGHAFLVPGDNIEMLFQQLERPHFGAQLPYQKVCPRAANKFVKMMAFPVMRVVTERTLSGLDELFRANVHPAELWDVIFGVVFLCLMVVSSTRRSLFQRALISAAKNNASFSREEAASNAQTMETEFVDYIISMFHDKFRTSSKGKRFNPLEGLGNAGQPPSSSFATYVKTMTERYCESPNPKSVNVGPRLIQVQTEQLRAMMPIILKLGGYLHCSLSLSFQDMKSLGFERGKLAGLQLLVASGGSQPSLEALLALHDVDVGRQRGRSPIPEL